MIENFVLIAFGGVMLASVFVFVNFANIANIERRAGNRQGMWLAFFLAMIAFGLIGVSALRIWDGLEGRDVGGSLPVALVIFLAILTAGKIGFHWAATFRRRQVQWYALLVMFFSWSIYVLVRPV